MASTNQIRRESMRPAAAHPHRHHGPSAQPRSGREGRATPPSLLRLGLPARLGIALALSGLVWLVILGWALA